MKKRNIYFDNAASTYVFDEVVDEINRINKNLYANASSLHKMGMEVNNIVKNSKEKLGKLLHTKPDTLVITSGGAESNNFALKASAFANLREGANIVITNHEHPTITNTALYLEKFGFDIRFTPLTKEGNLDLNKLAGLIDDKTVLVSTVHVSSETGALVPIKDISNLIKSINPKTVYHVDSVQALGKIYINLANLPNVDLMSFSSHKIHGPKGIGALYIKHRTKIDPFIIGSSLAGPRAGTLNTSGIYGFSLALDLLLKKRADNYTYIKSLKNYLLEKLEEDFSDEFINLSPQESIPHIISLSFRNINSEVLLNALSLKGVYISAGSACVGNHNKSSSVYIDRDLPDDYIGGAVRISFSEKNTKEEIDILIEHLKDIVPMLQLFVRR